MPRLLTMKIFQYGIIGYNFNIVIGILFYKFELHRLALILLVQLLFLIAIGFLEYQKRQDVISAFTPTFIGVIFCVLSFLIGVFI
jgi:uncharacterized membrane protein